MRIKFQWFETHPGYFCCFLRHPVGVPRATLGSVTGSEDSQDSVCSCTRSGALSRLQDAKTTSEGKGSPGDETRASGGPLPGESYRNTLNSSSNGLDNTWNVVYQESSLETQRWRFSLGAGCVDTPCLAHSKCQIPRRKAGVQHKPHCLHKQFRQSEPLLPFRESFISV